MMDTPDFRPGCAPSIVILRDFPQLKDVQLLIRCFPHRSLPETTVKRFVAIFGI